MLRKIVIDVNMLLFFWYYVFILLFFINGVGWFVIDRKFLGGRDYFI